MEKEIPVAPVPNENFVMATAVEAIPVVPVIPTTTNETIPIAPTLYSYDDTSPDVQERQISQLTATASATGRIAAIIEKSKIQEQNRKVAALHTQTEAHRIGTGTRVARELRDKVTARDTALQAQEVPLSLPKAVPTSPSNESSGSGGYQVGEYNVGSFKCQDYDSTYEYKSVYD